MNHENFTFTGTDIDGVKRKIDESGMSYNEAKAYIARTTGGHNTNVFSDTDIEKVKRDIEPN